MEVIIDIVELYDKGYSIREIADLLGLRQETILGVLQGFHNTTEDLFFA